MEEWLKSTKCAKTGRGSCGRGDEDHPGVERFLLPAAIGETWLFMTGAKLCNYFFAHVELGFCVSQNKYEKLRNTKFQSFSGNWCYELTPVLSLHPLNKQSSVVPGLACWRLGKWNSGNSFCVSEGSFPEKQIQPKLLCIGGKTSLIWNEFEGKWSTEKIFWKIAIWCWI